MVAKVRSAHRDQVSMEVIDYKALLSADHPARLIVNTVGKLDLSNFYMKIKSENDSSGRPATDPELLLCLWLYATSNGVGSARLLERLCESDLAYKWICGGVRVNHHTLSDFRTVYGSAVDKLLTDVITALLSTQAIKLKNIVLDGTKLKASAHKNSFKNRKYLESTSKRVKQYIKSLRNQLGAEGNNASTGELEKKACKLKRAEQKVEEALSILPKIEEIKKKRTQRTKGKTGKKISEAKVSLTDPDARLMRFPDKSIKAGYNTQLCIDAQSGLILGVDVSQQGNDVGLLKPMVDQLAARYNQRPERVLVDTGYQHYQDIDELETSIPAIKVYSPLKKRKPDSEIAKRSAAKRKRQDEKRPAGVKLFYARMKNKAAQLLLKNRSKIETINGIIHNRMLSGFHLRGVKKVKSEMLLQTLVHNLLGIHRLGYSLG